MSTPQLSPELRALRQWHADCAKRANVNLNRWYEKQRTGCRSIASQHIAKYRKDHAFHSQAVEALNAVFPS